MDYYRLKVENHKIAFSIKLNDITIFTNNHHELPSKEFNINPWIQPNENIIQLIISINPQFEEELKDQRCVVSVLKYTGEKKNFTQNELTKVTWNYVKDETKFPVPLDLNFTVDGTYFKDPIWKNGEKLTIDSLDKSSLVDFLSTFHQAMELKDTATIGSLIKTKTEELCHNQYFSLQESLQEQVDFFNNQLFAHPDWKMRPFEPKSLQVIFHDNGRLIEVVNKKGEIPIKSFPLDGDNFGIEMWLAYIDKKWVLCR